MGVVAYRLWTLRSADEILVLADRVVEQGSHEPLIGAGGLKSGLWAERQ